MARNMSGELISKIFIRGYKGIHALEMNNLARVNYFVGPNGSGKSSVLECVQLLSDLTSTGQGHEATIRGLSNYSLSDDLLIEVTYPNSKTISAEISKSTSIEIGGKFGTSSHTFKVNGVEIPLNRSLKQETVARSSKLINGRYVTSFAEQIEHPDYVFQPLNMSFDFNEVTQPIKPFEIVDFLNKYYPTGADNKVNNLYASIYKDKAIQFEIIKNNSKERVNEIPFASLSGGFRSLTRFYFGLQKIVRELIDDENWVKIISIEEPENGLHPEFHKKIPVLLEDLVNNNPRLIIFVTTHSPFLISAAATFETHKTYLFKDRQLVNSAFDSDNYAKEGYTGKRNLNVVAELLGAGFNDLGSEPKTNEKINIIYCEGAGKDTKDSEIYNILFPQKNTLFISCGGLTEVVQSHNLAKGASKFVFGKHTNVLALVDRSYSPADLPVGPNQFIGKTSSEKPIFTDQERDQFIASDRNGSLRMLKRKEIENYLFDPVVISMLEETQRASIQNLPTKEECIREDIKEKVKGASAEIKLNLAELINKHKEKETKEIYEELKECLKIE